MVACLFAVALLVAVVLHEAHAAPRCFLMVTGYNVNMVFGPQDGFNWRDITNNGWGTATLSANGAQLIVPGNPTVALRGVYNETTGCLRGGYDDTAQDLTQSGALAQKSDGSGKIEWPRTYVIPIEHPVQPPFFGRLVGGSTTTKTSRHFENCYKYGLEKKATGVEWHYENAKCVAHTGSDVKEQGRVAKIDKTPNTAGNHYRSLIYEPITLFGTTEERVYVKEVDSLDSCKTAVGKEEVDAKFVSWNKHSKKCYYSNKGGIIPTADDLYQAWTTLIVNMKGPVFDNFDKGFDCHKE